GPRGRRLAEGVRQRAVGRRRAGRDAEERLPDADLEVGALHAERERIGPRLEDAPGDRPGARLVGHEAGAGPAGAEVGQRRLGAFLGGAAEEGEAADPALGLAEEGVAEGRGVDAVADGEPCALALVLARRHRLQTDEEVVEPPGAGET